MAEGSEGPGPPRDEPDASMVQHQQAQNVDENPQPQQSIDKSPQPQQKVHEENRSVDHREDVQRASDIQAKGSGKSSKEPHTATSGNLAPPTTIPPDGRRPSAGGLNLNLFELLRGRGGVQATTPPAGRDGAGEAKVVIYNALEKHTLTSNNL